MSEILVRRGVLGNCDVTADGTDMVITVASGSLLFDNIYVPVSAQTVTLAAGDLTNARYDLIGIDSSGVIHAVAGTPDPNPVYPDTIPPSTNTGYIWLGAVEVDAAVTAITSGKVTDLRSNWHVTPPKLLELPQPADTLAYTLLSGAQSNADPGAGNCGFDTATVGTVGHLYVNHSSASDGTSTAPWLGVMAYGTMPLPFYLRLRSRKQPTHYILLEVTAITDHAGAYPAGYTDLTVTVIGTSHGTVPAPNTNPATVLSTDALDTILEFNGAAASSTTTNGEATLSTDTNITPINTFVDGPNTGSIGVAGQTWLLMATVTLAQATNAGKVTARLWDGTTVFAEAEQSTAIGAAGQIELKAIVNPTGAATYKVSCAAIALTATMKRQAPDNSVGGTVYTATKILWIRLS